jgi:hypothetical protein
MMGGDSDVADNSGGGRDGLVYVHQAMPIV